MSCYPLIIDQNWHNYFANHKNVSLTPTASKLLAYVILLRMYVTRSEQTREGQADLRTSRGCAEQISTVWELL